jgi:hypothetical protein
LLKATNKITAYAPQIEHQPCKPLNRPRQNAMPDTHLGCGFLALAGDRV